MRSLSGKMKRYDMNLSNVYYRSHSLWRMPTTDADGIFRLCSGEQAAALNSANEHSLQVHSEDTLIKLGLRPGTLFCRIDNSGGSRHIKSRTLFVFSMLLSDLGSSHPE